MKNYISPEGRADVMVISEQSSVRGCWLIAIAATRGSVCFHSI